MEAIHQATVVAPEPDGASAEPARGPIVLGPGETNGAYVVMIGAMPAGDDGPPLHIHPFTDEAF